MFDGIDGIEEQIEEMRSDPEIKNSEEGMDLLDSNLDLVVRVNEVALKVAKAIEAVKPRQ